MAQHSFTGTYQDFDIYYRSLRKKQVNPKAQVRVVFEVDEALTLEQEQKKADLVKIFQETENSYLQGKGKPFTPELLDSIIDKEKKRTVIAKK